MGHSGPGTFYAVPAISVPGGAVHRHRSGSAAVADVLCAGGPRSNNRGARRIKSPHTAPAILESDRPTAGASRYPSVAIWVRCSGLDWVQPATDPQLRLDSPGALFAARVR
ncbi:hypothetical protein NDU88_004809 [Pleurodeles waltl]|uniref:Uncharacterized protein n=1 Tax=Pleurodeles waltl TaxID=8319 RepID=A0AAV7TAS3_PLEWA|nr:hypothetical protein NDU88_004809 [Pleurodeles waltl]